MNNKSFIYATFLLIVLSTNLIACRWYPHISSAKDANSIMQAKQAKERQMKSFCTEDTSKSKSCKNQH